MDLIRNKTFLLVFFSHTCNIPHEKKKASLMFVLKCDFHTVQPDKWLSILNLREKKKTKNNQHSFCLFYRWNIQVWIKRWEQTWRCNLGNTNIAWKWGVKQVFYFHEFSHVYRAFWTFPKKPYKARPCNHTFIFYTHYFLSLPIL